MMPIPTELPGIAVAVREIRRLVRTGQLHPGDVPEYAGTLVMAAIKAGARFGDDDLMSTIDDVYSPDSIDQIRENDGGFRAEGHVFLFLAAALLARQTPPVVVGKWAESWLVYIARGCPAIARAIETGDDPDWWPIGQFPPELHERIKKAAGPGRKSKVVRMQRTPDGTRLYSAADALRWWPLEMRQGFSK